MHRPPASGDDNRIKSDALQHQPPLLRQEYFCRPADALLLSRQQRLLRLAKRFTRLYFDETQNTSGRMGNEIDLSRVGAYASTNYSIAFENEKQHSEQLAAPAPAFRQLVRSGFKFRLHRFGIA